MQIVEKPPPLYLYNLPTHFDFQIYTNNQRTGILKLALKKRQRKKREETQLAMRSLARVISVQENKAERIRVQPCFFLPKSLVGF